MSSSASPGARLAGDTKAQVTRGNRAKLSSMVLVMSAASCGVGGALDDGVGRVGKLTNHFCTSALASSVSKSPASTKVALLGAYHCLKKFLTSGIDAASRSSCRPIVV